MFLSCFLDLPAKTDRHEIVIVFNVFFNTTNQSIKHIDEKKERNIKEKDLLR